MTFLGSFRMKNDIQHIIIHSKLTQNFPGDKAMMQLTTTQNASSDKAMMKS